jgi:hypothetical protein
MSEETNNAKDKKTARAFTLGFAIFAVAMVAMNLLCINEVRIRFPQAERTIQGAQEIINKKQTMVCDTSEDTKHLQAKLAFASRRLDEARRELAGYHPLIALFTWRHVDSALWGYADLAYGVAQISSCGQPEWIDGNQLHPQSNIDPSRY